MKTIMIKDVVYRRLAQKKGNKSFSSLLDELLEKSKYAKSYRVALLDRLSGLLTDEEAKEAERRVRRLRENARVRT